MNETEFDRHVFTLPRSIARTLGWNSYHTLRSRGSKAGYPDRTVWRDRLLLAELKGDGGTPTDLQIVTLTQLAKAGAEVYLWRPSDEDEIGRILGGRWRFDPFERELRGAGGDWRPGSLWMPDDQRADGGR